MHDIYATAYHPPNLQMLRRYNVNRGIAIPGMAGLGNGEFLARETAGIVRQRRARLRAMSERARITAMSPAEKTAYDAKQTAIKKALNEKRAWQAEWNNGVESGRNLGNMLLSARGKILRNIIIRRDWDTLFKLFPVAPDSRGPGVWQKHWSLSKYSFTGDGANKRYVAWTEPDIRNWIFSPYYTIAPGHECSDAQRNTGVAAYMKAQARHKQKFNPSIYHYVWPIYPGRGYGDQTYGCQRDKDSWWVEHRKVVVAAVAVVAAVYLGPIIAAKIGAGGVEAAAGGAAGTGGGTAAGGIVGAGTKAGAAVITKAGAGAAITTKATGAVIAIQSAAEAGTLFSKVQAGVKLVNQARTIDSIIKGEMPPPPIGISGSNFTEWALDIAKKELIDEVQERTGEYLTKKMQEELIKKEEAELRAEIERMQRELAAIIPPGTPIMPSPELSNDVRARIAAMQNIERQRGQQNMILMALAAGGVFLAFG